MDADDHALNSFRRRMSSLRAELNRQLSDQPVEAVAGEAGLDPEDITALLDEGGDGDLYVVAKLETYFGVRLWPPLEQEPGDQAVE